MSDSKQKLIESMVEKRANQLVELKKLKAGAGICGDCGTWCSGCKSCKVGDTCSKELICECIMSICSAEPEEEPEYPV